MSELLDELAAAGRVEAHGGFTIDPEKAREKLRHYQLADPHRYVLLLVEAAVALGADKLEFEIDSDDMHLRFGGPLLEHAQLENFYASLFVRADQLESMPTEQLRTLRGVQQLAFALNSAMALNPRFARVVSIGPDGRGSALELHPSAPDRLVRVEGQPPGNHIHVKERFRLGLVVEFLFQRQAEPVLLEQHCIWSRTPVFVNGRAISRAMEFAEDVWSVIDVVDGSEILGRAALGLHASATDPAAALGLVRPAVDLLCNGVFVERGALDDRAVWGFRAIVDSRRLNKDASQSKLVQDAGYEAAIASSLAAQDRLIHRLAERRMAGSVPEWADAVLCEWLRLRAPSRPRSSALQRLLDEDQVFAAVAAVPLWPTIGAEPISTRTLIESKHAIRHADVDFEFQPTEVPFVLRVSRPPARALLEQMFGDRLQDYKAALEHEAVRLKDRLEFKTRRHAAELGEDRYFVREPIHGEAPGREGEAATPIRGELGVRVLAQQGSWVRLLSEGCLLREHQIDEPIPGLCVVVEAALTANDAYDGARTTPALAAALAAVLAALERALARFASSGVVTEHHVELRALLRLYIQQACRRDYGCSFLSEFGFSPRDAKRALEQLGVSLQPKWQFDAPPEVQHPLLHVPLYDRSHGSPCSLSYLSAQRAKGLRLAWLDPGVGPLPLFERDVFLLEQADRTVLREFFGADALEPFAEQLAWIRRRDAFLERRVAELAHTHATLAESPVSCEQPPLHGSLGLREYAFTAAGDGKTPVRVHYRQRELCELELELPFPGLTAWVDSDAFEVGPMFDGLVQPLVLRRPLLLALAGLCERELSRLAENPGTALRCEWWFVGMIPRVTLGDGGLWQAIVELRRTHDRGALLEELTQLLELQEQFPARDLDRALVWLRGRKHAPTAAAVRERLARPSRKLTDAERDMTLLRRALLPVLSRLLELPLIRRLDAPATSTSPRSVTLDELLVQVAAGRPISWVGDEFRIESMPQVDFDIVILDPIEQRLLDGLFGSAALELVSDWLIGRAQFERRRTTDEVRVPRGSALVVRTIDAPHIRGELGISRQSPSEASRSKIRLFTEAREIALLDIPARPFAIIGALDIDDLELVDAHDDITSDARERVQRFVADSVDPLIVELADRYESFERPDKTRAAEIVRHLLADWPPGAGGFAARAATRPSVFRRIAELPVFPGARKPWSAVELAEARERGRLATLTYRRQSHELPDIPVIVLETPEIDRTVRALYGELRDLDQELQRQRELDGRKASAPKLPSPPKRALVTIDVDGEGLLGHLWVHRSDDEIRFGEDGHVVESRVQPTACGCAGSIWGPQLAVAPDWSRVVLTRAQERLLERLACDLWERLLDEFERRSEQAAADDDELVALREAAYGLFLRLLAQLGARRKGKRQKQKGNRHERIFDRVYALPLLQLSNDRWISAEVATRERPLELASLGLWTGPSAEELQHQRSVERREAERRRERERAEEREHEAERRRADAKAREQEAARRKQAAEEARARAEPKPAPKPKPPEPEQKPADAPEKPEVRPVQPEELLLEAVREELRLVRADNAGLVSNQLLQSLVLGEPRRRGSLFRHEGGRVEFDVGHPLFRAVLDGYLDDPGLLTLLASAAYTHLNLVHVEIEDAHEAEFIRRHAAYAATSFGSDSK